MCYEHTLCMIFLKIVYHVTLFLSISKIEHERGMLFVYSDKSPSV
jgi:hypothetical protein